ncbi:hypothetical protein ACDI65_26560 [Klebsiella pneumoniae]|uniref:hypothetical protein n=1 Tax=Klebsiella pneumoniae TaxID=573 RepID=UPI0035323956
MLVVSRRTAIFINTVANWAFINYNYDRNALKDFQGRLRDRVNLSKLVIDISLCDDCDGLVSIDDADTPLVESILKSFKERNRGSNS